MIFYNLNLGKVVKVINDGKGFISFKPAEEPVKHGCLTYLYDDNPKNELVPKNIIELWMNEELV